MHLNARRFLSFVYILQTTWMSIENPVENPNLGRKKKKKNIKCWCCCYYYYCYQKWKKQCRISVFLLCGRLYVMYLCITCGLHFARCLSHEMKQFLVTKGFVSESCCCQDAISWTLSHLFSITNPFTHKAAITKLEVVSTLLISLLGSELNVSIK